MRKAERDKVRERLCTGWADKSEGASDASDDRVSALPFFFGGSAKYIEKQTCKTKAEVRPRAVSTQQSRRCCPSSRPHRTALPTPSSRFVPSSDRSRSRHPVPDAPTPPLPRRWRPGAAASRGAKRSGAPSSPPSSSASSAKRAPSQYSSPTPPSPLLPLHPASSSVLVVYHHFTTGRARSWILHAALCDCHVVNWSVPGRPACLPFPLSHRRFDACAIRISNAWFQGGMAVDWLRLEIVEFWAAGWGLGESSSLLDFHLDCSKLVFLQDDFWELTFTRWKGWPEKTKLPLDLIYISGPHWFTVHIAVLSGLEKDKQFCSVQRKA
jgi:hypothetical protein